MAGDSEKLRTSGGGGDSDDYERNVSVDPLVPQEAITLPLPQKLVDELMNRAMNADEGGEVPSRRPAVTEGIDGAATV